MKIGIVGAGVVGDALANAFDSKGYEVMLNDLPEEEWDSKKDLVKNCEVIFICVDTPTNERGCDLSKVYQAFNDLHFHIATLTREQKDFVPPVVAIKSTVIPGTTDSIEKMYPYVCSNPEFVRANTAIEDILHPDRIIIGTYSKKVERIMVEVYKEWGVPISIVKPVEAELSKYMSNAFLVTKVAFSQELDKISKMVGADPNIVYAMLVEDKRINKSHLAPGLGKIPIDSACLPKDLFALIKQLEHSGDNPMFLQTVCAGGVEGVVLAPHMKLVKEGGKE